MWAYGRNYNLLMNRWVEKQWGSNKILQLRVPCGFLEINMHFPFPLQLANKMKTVDRKKSIMLFLCEASVLLSFSHLTPLTLVSKNILPLHSSWLVLILVQGAHFTQEPILASSNAIIAHYKWRQVSFFSRCQSCIPILSSL